MREAGAMRGASAPRLSFGRKEYSVALVTILAGVEPPRRAHARARARARVIVQRAN